MRLAKGMTIEPATGKDTQAIASIFMANKRDRGLFQEPEARVRSNLRDFLVARDTNREVVACAGLHRDSDELAEIYGVAVLPEFQGQGIGAVIIQRCKEEAAAKQMKHLWLATVKPEYFRRYSFHPISRWSLPAPILLRKLRQVFQQPVQRWVPVLLGRHTFMKCDLLDMRISSSVICVAETKEEPNDTKIESELDSGFAGSMDGQCAVLNYASPAAVKFLDDILGELKSMIVATVSVFRWREGLPEGPHNPYHTAIIQRAAILGAR